MVVNSAAAGLNFSGGIQAVSYANQEKSLPTLPKAKRIIFFNEDAAPSNLAKLFRCFNARHLINRVCRPNKKEYETLQANNSTRQAMATLEWLREIDAPVDPVLKQKAETILAQFAEVELKVQIQRNLLTQV